MTEYGQGGDNAAFKAALALAAVAGEDPETLGARYGVSGADVKQWRRRLEEGAASLFDEPRPSPANPTGAVLATGGWAPAGAGEQPLIRRVLDSLFGFVGVLEPDGTLIGANAAPLAAAGISFADVCCRKFWDCYWWNWSEEVKAQLRDACARAARGEIVRYDVAVRMAGDTRMVIDLQVAPLRDASGRITHLIPSAFDITERVRQEEERRRRAEEIEKLMDLVPAAVFVASDRACTKITANRMGQSFYEADPDENVSAGVSQRRRFFEHGRELSPDELPMQVAAATGRDVRDAELEVLLPSGRSITIWGSATPLRDARGEIRGCIGAFVDTTERKRVEQRLREADRRKDEFLATLAHELRNPLAPIRAALEIQRLCGGDPRVLHEGQEMMERQVAHMVRLVDDLLDVSRITRGAIVLRRERVALADVVRMALETSAPALEAAERQLTVEMPTEALTLDADPVRLVQVVSNLLNNAVRYSSEGGHIRVTATREGAQAVLCVADDGIGIAPDMLPRVFDLFAQADRARGGGLGIGLTVVRSLVQMHGGRVEARSPGLGQGSELVVRLPLAEPARTETRPARPTTSVEARGRRVLIVDDNQDAAASLGMLLGLLGAEVRVAHDGAAALQTLSQWQPEIAFLDIGMPEMDGYELARRIRARQTNGDLQLVAITGWGQDDDRRRGREAGFDHHLTKPVGVEELTRVLSRRTTARQS